jgi:hypothetical protein
VTELEASYRRALRWYPRNWRARNEEAVVGTLLDRAEEERRATPGAGELADLRTSALAARLGPLGRIPAPIRNRAAALAFGLGSGIAIAAPIAIAVQKATLPPVMLHYLPTVGPFVGFGFLFYGTWILALITALVGLKWATRILAFAAVAVGIALHALARGTQIGAPTTTTIVLVGMLAILACIGNPFATTRGRWWIATASLAWAAFIGLTLWYQHITKGGVAGSSDWFLGPLWLWLYWVVPFALILALVLLRLHRPAWGGAIIILLVPIVPFVLFGWGPRSDELADRVNLLVIAIAIVTALYFASRLVRRRDLERAG